MNCLVMGAWPDILSDHLRNYRQVLQGRQTGIWSHGRCPCHCLQASAGLHSRLHDLAQGSAHISYAGVLGQSKNSEACKLHQ